MEKSRKRIVFWSFFLIFSFGILIILLTIGKEQKFVKRIEEIKKAEKHPYVQLLKEYVQIDTSEPKGNTFSSAVFLAMILKEAGIDAEIFESVEGKANLIAKIGNGKKPPVILHHHMDTAEVLYEDEWSFDPWGGTIHNGFMYGIGVLDVKSMGLCFLHSFIRAYKEKWDLKRPVIYYASCAEESNMEEGSKWMLKNHPEFFPEGALFLSEGGLIEMVTDVVRNVQIEIGQKGFGWFDMKISEELKNKLEREIIKVLPDTPNPNPYVLKFLKDISKFKVDYFKDNLADIENYIKGKKKDEMLIPYSLRALLFTDGWWIKKDSENYRFIISTVWGEKLDFYIEKISEILKKNKVDFKITKIADANVTSPESEEYEKIKKIYEEFFNVPVLWSFPSVVLTESSLFRQKGLNAYGICLVRYTIFESYKMNIADERVYLPYFIEGIEISDKILKEIACN